ncbi:hypothetical protein KC218_27355, partial [Mycobacterium tuberculosis]|nr:hypothetical protein [Mycobacterium tuberculosis]
MTCAPTPGPAGGDGTEAGQRAGGAADQVDEPGGGAHGRTVGTGPVAEQAAVLDAPAGVDVASAEPDAERAGPG